MTVNISSEVRSRESYYLNNFISQNGNEIISTITGIRTEYVSSAVHHLAGTAEAIRSGRYTFAAVEGVLSFSAMFLAGTNLLIPKEVRQLNRLTRM